MSQRTLFILAAVVMVLTFVTPVLAAPKAQETVNAVVVTSATTFTLTVMIDDVTTLAIPMQVDWRAEGPTEGNADEVRVSVSPTVLRTGIFSVTVGSVGPTTGTLSMTLSQPVEEIAPITETATTTSTDVPPPLTPTTEVTTTTEVTPTTDVNPITVPPTTTVDVPAANTPTATANTIVNLRAGPGTDYDIVGGAELGDALDIVGQNSDGTWLALSNGAWVAAILVDNAPVDLPIIESIVPLPTPLPTPVAPDILLPTATPAP